MYNVTVEYILTCKWSRSIKTLPPHTSFNPNFVDAFGPNGARADTCHLFVKYPGDAEALSPNLRFPRMISEELSLNFNQTAFLQRQSESQGRTFTGLFRFRCPMSSVLRMLRERYLSLCGMLTSCATTWLTGEETLSNHDPSSSVTSHQLKTN
jgi:hypothetical protein